jgi:hypothetical protein
VIRRAIGIMDLFTRKTYTDILGFSTYKTYYMSALIIIGYFATTYTRNAYRTGFRIRSQDDLDSGR